MTRVRLWPCVFTISLIVLGTSLAEGEEKVYKLSKRNVESGNDYSNGKRNHVQMVKKNGMNSDEELQRFKRYKRDAGNERFKRHVDDQMNEFTYKEKELKRYKRNKRSFDDEPELKRYKRNKRSAEIELKRYKRQDVVPENIELGPSINKIKRSLKEKKLEKKAKRTFRKPDTAGLDLKRSQRVDTRKIRGGLQNVKKHAKKYVARPLVKRHRVMNRENPIELYKKGRLDDIVKKAIMKFKRPQHHAKHSKASKRRRSKRAGHIGIKESSKVLKDISKDISRLQRLRRGIARKVLNAAKTHNAAKVR